MKQIPLTQGKFALVDNGDFDFLNQWKWYFDGRYATRNINRTDGSRTKIRIHQCLFPNNLYQIDHKDLNKLNNQKNNLRPCNNSQNHMNQKTSINNTSGFKGVQVRGSSITAYINLNNHGIYLGTFSDKITAAKAYDKKAKELFGEFARVNFPD